ncbi:DNA (cytosine-5)-methyltransferase 1 [Orussus abietinus]|uniref:DNA (cytosine-5)-methyltransferase 1 n=1 Tax=Orussus abietinus TaxID=222816 RepID=UPI000C7161AB|nr:DNA (cytosine-5)-methyltransferase 1 [Orussus abietinus]XP_023289400.1 DNA (cytosine-5)-methyltransferase 1 [Orussus abietinus]
MLSAAIDKADVLVNENNIGNKDANTVEEELPFKRDSPEKGTGIEIKQELETPPSPNSDTSLKEGSNSSRLPTMQMKLREHSTRGRWATSRGRRRGSSRQISLKNHSSITTTQNGRSSKRKILAAEVQPLEKFLVLQEPSIANGNISEAVNVEQETMDCETECNSNVDKKIKLDIPNEETTDSKGRFKKPIKEPEKCELCRQKLVDGEIALYPGHPNGAVEEYIALTDPRLSLFTGEEAAIAEGDERPQNKLTYFSVYDKNGHLCPFDTGLLEKNVFLYFSGYMKAIYEEDSSAEGGVPTKDIGPFNEWWLSGFDGGELALIGVGTAFAEYILMEPSEAYAPFMVTLREKIHMSKFVIEFLLDEVNPSYEDLLNKLQTAVPPKGVSNFTEDSLLRHAQFVCDQVLSFDTSAKPEDPLLIVSPCMRALVSLAGVTIGKRLATRRAQRRDQKSKKPAWTRATTTQLVNNMFETFFTEQLAQFDKEPMGPKRRRCGVCEACQQPACGVCPACKDMVKFGGTGRSKQACVKRRCPNMAIQEADDSEPEDEEAYQTLAVPAITKHQQILKSLKRVKKEVKWLGESIATDAKKVFYSGVDVSGEEIRVNDYVMIEPSDPSIALQLAKVMYMWENKKGECLFHGNWFRRGSDTVLGETSDPTELFLIDECDDLVLTSIKTKATVTLREPASDWAELGNQDTSLDTEASEADGKAFFYQKMYIPSSARFEDPPVDPPCEKDMDYHYCPACLRSDIAQERITPKVFERGEEKSDDKVVYGMVRYKDEEYRVGSSVYLFPGAFKFTYVTTWPEPAKVKKEKVDEDVYPEFYRKSSEHVKGSNYDTPEPFHIGYITSIFATTTDKVVPASDIWITAKKMYRPENTHKGPSLTQQVDLNVLYWSDEERSIRFTEVAGKCYVVSSETLDQSVEEWTAAGPNRFYFTQAYNIKEKTFTDPPAHALIGKRDKGKAKGKGRFKIKSKKAECEDQKKFDVPVNHCSIARKLRTLDVFAGCGGLSEGLRQAGVAESLWAIEKEEPAAHAYRFNNPDTVVFSEDCNVLLKRVMDGDETDDNGQRLPKKGEVELLCGGPPCQGFSGMNRFNSRQYSLFKNSLVVSYLSYCDYYRPRFFVMENVRNFVSFKRSMVLKLTLRCLIRMGYQCTFGILQAGNYGVPQTRRRLFILAAAPGEILPRYPEPTHVFSKHACQLSVVVDDQKYSSNCEWTESAPYRTISVRDAMSDLPSIRNGWSNDEMAYSEESTSHFQRKMRGNECHPKLRDHVCKEMAPLVEARMAHIPTASGSDWRDLPNIVVRLSDGTFSKKLEYPYDDKKAGRSSKGARRGVCSCCIGKPCDPMDRQFNTLIPWCLPHTGNRHNNWAGLYGRLEWDGFFGTTITNPEPMGKQGRVLHPEQTRLVSVRECARSQGFPDTFRFFGTVLDKHRQVGNAVPPPLGAAIGREIRKCLDEGRRNHEETTVEPLLEPKPATDIIASSN